MPRLRFSVQDLSEVDIAYFRKAAQARGMTQPQFMSALLKLHRVCRELDDTGRHEWLGAELERLGLQTVQVKVEDA